MEIFEIQRAYHPDAAQQIQALRLLLRDSQDHFVSSEEAGLPSTESQQNV